ncbi:unnamed protein product, partial [Cylicocyclus nassatus]
MYSEGYICYRLCENYLLSWRICLSSYSTCYSSGHNFKATLRIVVVFVLVNESV